MRLEPINYCLYNLSHAPRLTSRISCPSNCIVRMKTTKCIIHDKCIIHAAAPPGCLNPYTLHPTPHTLHPAPCTLHLTTYTLDPTPHTLHPTHSTIRMHPRFVEASACRHDMDNILLDQLDADEHVLSATYRLDHILITVRAALSRPHHSRSSHPNDEYASFRVEEHVLSATYRLDHILITVRTALSRPHHGLSSHPNVDYVSCKVDEHVLSATHRLDHILITVRTAIISS